MDQSSDDEAPLQRDSLQPDPPGVFSPKLPREIASFEVLKQLNNPKGEPTGRFTGRCQHCGSKDLWDDNLAYGCNICGALLGSNF